MGIKLLILQQGLLMNGNRMKTDHTTIRLDSADKAKLAALAAVETENLRYTIAERDLR